MGETSGFLERPDGAKLAWRAVAGDGPTVASLTDTGDGIALVVADCGPGVPAEAVAHLFEPFYLPKDRPGLAFHDNLAFIQDNNSIRINDFFHKMIHR